MTKLLSERFMAYVDKAGPNGCWLWTGGKSSHGYGAFRMFQPKRTVRAHRLSYEMHKGPIPSGLHVCHGCDNPGCVNPDHLWLGTPADNARDRDAKNRVQSGERHYAAKLTAADVADIIRASSGTTQDALASKFGITQSAVSHIVSGRRWKRVHAALAEERGE